MMTSRKQKQVTEKQLRTHIVNMQFLVKEMSDSLRRNTREMIGKKSELRKAQQLQMDNVMGSTNNIKNIARDVLRLQRTVSDQENAIQRMRAASDRITQASEQQRTMQELSDIITLMERIQMATDAINPFEVAKQLTEQMELMDVQQTLLARVVDTPGVDEDAEIQKVLEDSAIDAGVPLDQVELLPVSSTAASSSRPTIVWAWE